MSAITSTAPSGFTVDAATLKLCQALAELASAASYLEASARAGGTPERYEAFAVSDGTRRGRIAAAVNCLDYAPASADGVSLTVGEELIRIEKGPSCRQ